MKQIQPFQKHWLQITSIVVCRLKGFDMWDKIVGLDPCQDDVEMVFVNIIEYNSKNKQH